MLFAAEELGLYNGIDEALPIQLGILGYAGKLVGHYYDSNGNPTKCLKGVEAKAARGAQLLEKQKKEEAKQPSCNSRWSQDEGGQVFLTGKHNGILEDFVPFYATFVECVYVQISPETSRNRFDRENEQALRLLHRGPAEQSWVGGLRGL